MTTPTDSINGLKLGAMYNNNVSFHQETLNERIMDEIYSNVALMGGFKLLQKGYSWITTSKESRKAASVQNKAVFDKIKSNYPKKWTQVREYNSYQNIREMNVPKKPVSHYGRTVQIVQNQVSNGKGVASYRDIERNTIRFSAKEDFLAHGNKVSTQRTNSSVLRGIKDRTGLTKLSTKSKALAVKSPAYAKFTKGFSRSVGPIYITLTFLNELVSNVIPAFREVGTGAGFKQLGKSSAKAIASCAAWGVGEVVGKAAGAPVCGLVGSAFGPKGAVVGATVGGEVCGIAGGVLCMSYVDDKMDKILGKTEVEKAKDEKTEKDYQEALQNPEKFRQLCKKVSDKMVENYYGDGLSEDDYVVAEKLFGIDFNDNLTREYFIYSSNPQRYEQYLKENYADGVNFPVGVDENNQSVYEICTPDQVLNILESIKKQQISEMPEEEDCNGSKKTACNPGKRLELLA